MIKGKIWWVVVVVFFLTSCTSNQPLSSGLATRTITKQPVLPTITPKITTTQTSKPTVEAEVISPLEEIVFGDSLEVQPNLPEDVYIPWHLLTSDGEHSILLDVGSGVKNYLSFFDEVGSDGLPIRSREIKVSPNGKWIAYEGSYSEKDKLYIDSTLDIAEMTEENSVGLEIKQPYRLRRWVDSDTLLIHYQDPDAPYLYLTSFFDPISGEEHIFSIRDLPNYLDVELGGAFIVSHYGVDGDLIPDPTMSRIIYPSIIHETFEIQNNLWDIKEQKTIIQFRYIVEIGNQPFWSLDGNDFVMLTWVENEGNKFDEWFLMDQNGKQRIITNFSTFMENDDYYFRSMNRSPDGQFFVFQLNFESDGLSNRKYIVLDMENHELTGFCIASPQDVNNHGPMPWSPDSRYIVLDNTTNGIKGDMLVVDVKEQKAYKVAEDMYAYGWIERNP